MKKLAVILAGGLSSRMGQEKSLLAIGGEEAGKNKFLIDKVIAAIAPTVDAIAINANHDGKRFAYSGLEILPDEKIFFDDGVLHDDKKKLFDDKTSQDDDSSPDKKPAASSVGPLIGILTAMNWAKKMGGEMVLTVSCDCPQLPLDLYQQLATQPNHDVVVAKTFGHHHPTIALWRVDLAAALKTAINNGVRKIDKFTAPYNVATVDFTPSAPKKINDKTDDAQVIASNNSESINMADPFLNLNRQEEFAAWLAQAKK